MHTFDYDAAVQQMRRGFENMVEERLTIGLFVIQAEEAGYRPSQIANDVGVHWNTLRKYRRVASLWGTDRIPDDRVWTHYSAAFAHGYTDAERLAIKDRLMAGESPHQVYTEARRSCAAAVRARDASGRPTWVDDVLESVIIAREDMNDLRRYENRPLPSGEDLERLGIEIRKLIEDAVSYGVPIPRRTRPLRAAS